ncbi:MAG TPA: hypothetical protein PK200_18120, partial [Spirochaetota bacterium]|nr:hypothetical protein [Spirochaetota bacterium]
SVHGMRSLMPHNNIRVDSARLGVLPRGGAAFRPPSGLASRGHLPRFGGGLWEFGFSALDEW